MIKAVLSDGGDILFTTSTTNALYNFIAKRRELSYPEFRTSFERFREKANTEPEYSMDQAVEDYLFSIGLGGLADIYRTSQEREDLKTHRGRRVIDGVASTLKTLKQMDIPYIVLTDASLPANRLMEQLSALGLEGLVADIISSKDLGVQKPDPVFFDFALKKHRLRKEEVLFVAHDYDELRGAHDYGLETVAFNYDPTLDLSFIPEDNKIPEFRELLEIVKKPRL